MAGKKRAYGADVAVLIGRYGADGSAPAAYKRILISSTSLSADQALGYDALIGGGTNEAQDPYYEAVNDSGDIVIPMDVRAIGMVLSGIFGLPVTTGHKASGKITFAANPDAAATIALNGTAWTFVAGAAGAAETTIGANLAATLAALADDLNASAEAEIAKCTYSATATELVIEHDTAGTAANAYTIAASATSNGKPDAGTLRGGGYQHVFTSGGDDVPEHIVEIGHVKLTTPKYYRHDQVKMGGLKFQMAQSGRAKMTVPLIGVDESEWAGTVSGAPGGYDFAGFSNSGGYIEREGARLGDVVGGALEYANGLEAIRTIRDDMKIDGADTGEHTSKGSITVRFGGAAADGLLAKASAQAPTTIRQGFTHPAGWSLDFALSRVFLPRPKKEIRGPGGIEQQFDFQASGASGTMLTVTLINDVANYTA